MAQLKFFRPSLGAARTFRRRFRSAVSQNVSSCCKYQRNLRAARDLLLPKLISGEIEIGATKVALEAAAG